MYFGPKVICASYQFLPNDLKNLADTKEKEYIYTIMKIFQT